MKDVVRLGLAVGALFVASACSSDDSAENDGSGGGPANTGGMSAQSGGVGAGGGATSGGQPSSTACAAPDLGVHYVGRVDGCDSTGARYAWSGSGFIARFDGVGLSARLLDTSNQHTVLVDGELQPTLKTTTGEATYVLATGLDPGEHIVEVYRRSEASFGATQLLGVEVADGELLTPPAPPERRIEVVGDSISCGYGNEGTAPCAFSIDTENHYLAYPAVMARSLNAEVSTVAWSGKGVIFNYNGNLTLPLPTLYDYTVPSDRKHAWSFQWQPQAVVINLGTNDFSSGTNPTDDVFVARYRALLSQVRAVYPDAFLLCTVGPMLSGAALAKTRTNIAAAVSEQVAGGDARVRAYEMTTPNTAPGCDYHPSVATQAAMAAELGEQLQNELGWN